MWKLCELSILASRFVCKYTYVCVHRELLLVRNHGTGNSGNREDPDKDEASHCLVTPPHPSTPPFPGQQPGWGVHWLSGGPQM